MNTLQNNLIHFIFSHQFPTFWSSPETFLCVSLGVVVNSTVNTAAKCYSMERQTHNLTAVSSSTLFTGPSVLGILTPQQR